jgi:hypothetical protein
MATIAEIDTRLFDPQQQAVRLKIARNALVPLGRLPDALLVHIARHFVLDPY